MGHGECSISVREQRRDNWRALPWKRLPRDRLHRTAAGRLLRGDAEEPRGQDVSDCRGGGGGGGRVIGVCVCVWIVFPPSAHVQQTRTHSAVQPGWHCGWTTAGRSVRITPTCRQSQSSGDPKRVHRCSVDTHGAFCRLLRPEEQTKSTITAVQGRSALYP